MDFSVFLYVFSSGVARFWDARDRQSKWTSLTYYELKDHNHIFLYRGPTGPSGPGPHTQHITFGRTPVDEWSAPRRDLLPLPDNTQHSQQTSIPPLGFEPTIPVSERPQTHALDRTAPGIGIIIYLKIKYPFYRPFAAPWTLLPGAATPFAPPWLHPWCLHHENESSRCEPWLLCTNTKVSLWPRFYERV